MPDLTQPQIRQSIGELEQADALIIAAYRRIEGAVPSAGTLLDASAYVMTMRRTLVEMLREPPPGGGVDDTAQLQGILTAAVNANMPAVLPARQFTITRTLTFQSSAMKRHYASLIGAGQQSTGINWAGPAGVPMLDIRGMFGGVLSGFALRGSVSARPSAGIYFPATSQHPSAGRLAMTDLHVEAARRGYDFGGAEDRQVSEITLTNCEARDCTEAGFRVEGWNALNYLFLNCAAAGTPAAWLIDRCNAMTILGGSCSDVGCAYRTNAGGTHQVIGLRVENSLRFADLGSFLPGNGLGAIGAPIRFRAASCDFSYGAATSPGAVVRIFNPGPTRIEACMFGGGHIDQVFLGNWHGALTVEDCTFDKSAGEPVRVTGSGTNRGRLRATNCRICALQPPAGGEPVGAFNREQVF